MRARSASSISRHEHLGAGEYRIISGKMEVRDGVENSGIMAMTRDYGYEPNGVILLHDQFLPGHHSLFTNFGPIRYIDDDDNTSDFWIGRAF